MLTRRHIRIKVMQTIYALSDAGQINIDEQGKFLVKSIRDIYNLYLTMLSLLIEIRSMAEHQLTISQKKYLATKEEKNPNRKFVNNKVLKMLSDNVLLKDEIKKKSDTNWNLNDEYIKIIYDRIIESELYKNYMLNPNVSFGEDRAFLTDIFKECIATDDKLYDYIEDHKLTWVDDFPLVNTSILKTLKKSYPKAANHHFLIGLYKDKEDQIFSRELFRQTVACNEELQNEIKGKTPNWDIDRIASIDAILLKMAICEFLKFPTIPVKVTINEYLEIAKEYSTPKSSIFINGVLDKLVKDYTLKKKLNKRGRGLI